jgi:Flp pilus assembly protein TadG
MKLRRAARRRGMTIVESALVLAVFCLLLFGVFEYCRFLYVMHIVQNAARDGARYAAVNQDKPPTFDATDYTDAGGTTFTNIQSYTKARMGGADKQLSGCNVAVYAVDSVGLSQPTPIIRPKSQSPPTYPNPFNPSDPNKVPWNQASFAEGIAVSVQGTYTPLLPSFLKMPAAMTFTITAISGAEG